MVNETLKELEYLNKTKAELKQILTDKRLEVSDEDTFRTMVGKVNELENTATVEEHIDEVEQDLEATKAKLDTVESELSAKIEENTTGIETLESAVEKVITVVEKNTTDIATNTDNIQEAKTDIIQSAANIAQNASEIVSIKSSMEDQEKAIEANKTATEKNAIDIASNAEAIKENSAAIVENKTAIESNAEAISANSSAIKGNTEAIKANVEAIESNKTAIETNKANIEKNVTDIASNKEAIEKNATDIATNKSSIETNTEDIKTNKTAIETNKADIDAAKLAIDKNIADIASNKEAIEKNATDIATNKTSISEVSAKVEKNTTDIATNKSDIESNATAIAQNSIAIQSNTEAIKENETAIRKNTTDIATNAANIESNKTAIDANKAAIDKNTIDIAVNKSDIEDNTEAIMMNTKDISSNKAAIIENKTNIAQNATAITTLNNNIEDNAEAIAERVTKAEAQTFVKDISYDGVNCTFTFTLYNDSTVVVDLPLESTVKDGRYDGETQELVLTLTSGQEIRIPAVDLIDIYTGSENDQVNLTVSQDNVIEAVLKADSIGESFLTPELRERLTTVESNITNNDEDIAKLVEKDLAIDTEIQNLKDKDTEIEGSIATNKTAIEANTSAIEKNATDIATNKESIEANTSAIEKNATDIAANKEAIEKNSSDLNDLDARTVQYDSSNNVFFRKDVALQTNQKLLGATPDDNDYHVLAATLAWNVGTENEFIQNEFGSSHVHMNLNSKDRPTVELPDGKEEVAYKSELEDLTTTSNDAIEANTSAIEKNATDIATNKSNIEANAEAIATNKSDIATNKSNIEANAKAIEERVTKVEAQTFVKDIAYDNSTYKLTFTLFDNSKVEIDLPLESTVKDGRYDVEKQSLVLVLVSGQEIEIPAKDLIDIYTGSENSQIKLTVSGENVIEAILKVDSIGESFLAPEVRERLTTIEANITSNATEIAKLKDKDISIDTEIQGLKAKDIATDSDIQTLKSKDATIESNVATNKSAIEKNASNLTALDARTVQYDSSNNVFFKNLVVLGTNQKLLGTTPDDNNNHVLVATMAWNIGTEDEYIQNEFGSSHVHMNLNSKDRPTIEMPTGKEEVAYKAELDTISTEANAAIESNTKAIEKNATDIASNKEAIEANAIEIANNKTAIEERLTLKEAKPLVKDVAYDGETCIFTFTAFDGTTKTFDLPLESSVKSGYYDTEGQNLVLVLINDTEIKIPAVDLIDIYTGTEGDQIAVSVSKDNVISAILKADSIDESFLTEDLRNRLTTIENDIKANKTLINNNTKAIEDNKASVDAELETIKASIETGNANANELKTRVTENEFDIATLNDRAALYDGSDNLFFRKDVVLKTNQKLLGTTPDDNDNHVLAATLAWNVGTENEYIQNEFGSTHVHANLNSKDRPTVETSEGKEEIAYKSELESAQADITAVTEEVKEIVDTEVASLKEKDTAIEAEIADLKTADTTIQETITTLEAKVDESVEDLTNGLSQNTTAIEANKTSIDAINTELDGKVDQFGPLNTDILCGHKYNGDADKTLAFETDHWNPTTRTYSSDFINLTCTDGSIDWGIYQNDRSTDDRYTVYGYPTINSENVVFAPADSGLTSTTIAPAIREVKGLVDTNITDVTNLTTRVDNVENVIDTKLEPIEARITANETNIATNTQSILDLVARDSELETSITTNVEALNTAIEETNKLIGENTTAIETNTTAIETLDTKVDTHIAEFETFKTDNATALEGYVEKASISQHSNGGGFNKSIIDLLNPSQGDAAGFTFHRALVDGTRGDNGYYFNYLLDAPNSDITFTYEDKGYAGAGYSNMYHHLAVNSENVVFDAKESGLASTAIASAIREVKGLVDEKAKASDLETVNTKITEIETSLDTKQNKTDETLTTTSKEVVGAINEIKTAMDNIDLAASKVTFDNTGTDLTATTVQEAIIEINAKIGDILTILKEINGTTYTDVNEEGF